MMKLFEFHVVLCVLVWTAHASDFKSLSSVATHFRKTRNHAEEGHSESQSNSIVSGFMDTVAQSSRAAAISGNLAPPQADQATDSSRSPVRRVVKGRRPVPARKPGSVPAPDAFPPRQGPQVSSFRVPNGTSSINVLAGFAGRNRVLVISAPHESEGYYRLMMSLLKPNVYCEMADRHMQQIVMFHEKGEMGGKVRRVSNQGTVTEEPLDPDLVPRLMSFLKLEEGKFGMVLLRKTLQVEERYPYPVRLEAMYEVIDQTPMRRLEKARQKGFVERCRAAGMEGQVVQTAGSKPSERQKGARPTLQPKPTRSTATPLTIVTTTTRPTTVPIATTKPLTTTFAATTQLPTTIASTTLPTTLPSTTTTSTTLPTRAERTDLQTPSHRHKAPLSTSDPTYRPATTSRQRDHTSEVTYPSITSAFMPQHGDKHKDRTDKISPRASPPAPHARRRKPIRDRLPKGKNVGREQIDEHAGEREAGKPTASEPGENLLTTKSVKATPAKAEKKKKTEKPEKPVKKNIAEKKASKASKDTEANLRNRNAAKKADSLDGKGAAGKRVEKPTEPRRSLETFLSYFEKRRRLLVITTPSEQNRMYSQQRDEYLEQVCDMALRKISIITVFGPLGNGTMKIEHFQMEQDKPVRGLPDSELINQELITAFRKELGMLYNDFYMVLTDFDMKVKQEYEVPIIMKAVFDYIDTFSSRLKEMELQRKLGIACKKEDKSRSLENFLSRFRWRRRLLVISTPDHEEWAYQQQLYAMTSQACNLGLRHMSVLKLVGKAMDDMGGVLELYPINGSATVDREDLSASLVRDIRNYFQVSPEYFSMLLVGKDGNVKSWYPSPMWSMSIIYDLIDSMQLRRQEMAIQLSLGMRCPEDGYSHHDGYHEGYHHGYGY
ncbi:coiled-coil domain-containing protein 80 [Pygocentrus nattereri]|uniref:Coiled-coil domain-containing protein 80 n=1 Tax=Pygocentrus nattereri TaxID=42514 RepID=A0A3B4DLR1_PYGNA|nr:coiled-coil domain-containing protein 80 [Pygocentrus nattereri]